MFYCLSSVIVRVTVVFRKIVDHRLMKTLHLTLKMTTAQQLKHQSPTTVFLKTSLTQMITQDKKLILLGSNH